MLCSRTHCRIFFMWSQFLDPNRIPWCYVGSPKVVQERRWVHGGYRITDEWAFSRRRIYRPHIHEKPPQLQYTSWQTLFRRQGRLRAWEILDRMKLAYLWEPPRCFWSIIHSRSPGSVHARVCQNHDSHLLSHIWICRDSSHRISSNSMTCIEFVLVGK